MLIKILLGILTVLIAIFIIKFIKYSKNARLNFNKENEKKNIDLSLDLNEEFSLDADVENKPLE